ncbi:MAG: ATP phosphoribosyltransferase [Chloroflexota bacterium]|nr:ATP phosphoribosyltransferase [Chloroflexota bacterium]
MESQIKLALPKGRLLDETAALLQKANFGLSGYQPASRLYRLKSRRFAQLAAKVFHERDIPIQVAVGNYDIGICGLDWVEELLAKYPGSGLVKVKALSYGAGRLSMVASRLAGLTMSGICASPGKIRIASEYPNLSEAFALGNRLRRFQVFPLWGAAEVYPPESADLALVAQRNGAGLDYDLVPLSSVLDFSACLIANQRSWETKDLSEILDAIEGQLPQVGRAQDTACVPGDKTPQRFIKTDKDTVRLALPDGHQQVHTVNLLKKASIQIDDYPSGTGNRRPNLHLDGFTVKVIRPQDMPLQVANGNFDLAITGRDWLREHLYQFPSSPVTELLDLKYGRVKIVAVISQDLPVTDTAGLRKLSVGGPAPLRVASEYVNIADKYARDNHLGMYRVVPTWGASEAFLPEDADLLIENTETGQTLVRHNLRVIETLFESTGCLIGHKDGLRSPAKKQRIKSIIEVLRRTVEA